MSYGIGGAIRKQNCWLGTSLVLFLPMVHTLWMYVGTMTFSAFSPTHPPVLPSFFFLGSDSDLMGSMGSMVTCSKRTKGILLAAAMMHIAADFGPILIKVKEMFGHKASSTSLFCLPEEPLCEYLVNTFHYTRKKKAFIVFFLSIVMYHRCDAAIPGNFL
ncbi:hypothetical protein F4810DRAFT_618463 [Camillea tinctor]|nr:hypothetical protein F4810DRAFT_618463 [Camillea tinctor]